MANERPNVVIVGAGFGGLEAAKALARAPVAVTVIDLVNHHCFQPLLYQVATAVLSPSHIGTSIRSLLGRQRNTRVLQGIVTPVVLIYILILTNRKDVLGDAANKPLFRTVATVAIAGISAMSLLLLGQTVLGWFGIG